MIQGYPQGKYTVEIVDPNGQVLADLGGRAANRQFTLTRNAADDIQWFLNLDEFEDYCRRAQVDPKLVLITDVNEVRIKRLGTYFAAGQLNYKYGTLAENGSGNLLQLKATGFLNLFASRYTGPGQVYTAMDGSQIAWDLINTSQTGGNDYTGTLNTTTGKFSGGTVSAAYWDYGITQGSLATVGNHNRTYNQMAITDCLQDLSSVATGSFDFQFTYDKKFNTFAQLGTQRPDIIFEYPGNIMEIDPMEDGTQLFNQIIAQGSGNGTDAQNSYVANNTSSALTYKVRQQFVSPSSLQTGDSSLQDFATWNLTQTQFPLVLPSFQVDGSKKPYITDYQVGDWVRVRIRNHPLYSDINGMYRVEQIKVQVDDNDFEMVTITTSLT